MYNMNDLVCWSWPRSCNLGGNLEHGLGYMEWLIQRLSLGCTFVLETVRLG